MEVILAHATEIDDSEDELTGKSAGQKAVRKPKHPCGKCNLETTEKVSVV